MRADGGVVVIDVELDGVDPAKDHKGEPNKGDPQGGSPEPPQGSLKGQRGRKDAEAVDALLDGPALEGRRDLCGGSGREGQE